MNNTQEPPIKAGERLMEERLGIDLKLENDILKGDPNIEGNIDLDIVESVNETKDTETMRMPTDSSSTLPRLTDAGNAERFAIKYGDRVRFDHRHSRWLVWKGHRWQSDADGAVRRYSLKNARALLVDSSDLNDTKAKLEVSRFAILSESAGKIEATLNIAKYLKPVADEGTSWDLQPMLLAVKNGVIDLTTGNLRDGKPDDRITQVADVSFDEKAESPLWINFLNEVFQEDAELVRYLQKCLGYSLTGLTNEQVLFICFGQGSNGKSVFFKIIQEILGDYAHNAPSSLFQKGNSSAIPNDVAATESKRFLISSETLTTSRLNEQRLKSWTGGDKQTARFLNHEFFTFEPTAKPWLFVNHKPVVDDDSYGFWRRVRVISFNRVFAPKEQDHELSNKLKSEKSGILNWMIEGCLLCQKEGLNPTPEIVTEATRAYQEESDLIAQFLSDCCELNPNSKVKAAYVYKTYTGWCEEQGLLKFDVLTRTAFGRRLSDKFAKKHENDGTYYFGISLKTSLQSDGFNKRIELKNDGYDGLGVKNDSTPRGNTAKESDPKSSHNPSHPSLSEEFLTQTTKENKEIEETLGITVPVSEETI